jgi:Transposase DDE domain
MPWYCRVKAAINTVMPFLVPTQATNLALLVSAILKKQTLCLSELARAYPTPEKRRVPVPKHDLLHRLKRLWRFTSNERGVDPLEVQMALVPYTIACLDFPRFLGLAIDWTMFNTTLPSGKQMRYQVLRIAVPRKGRALPLLQLAYDRDTLSPNKSQNQLLEQDALLAVVRALPMSIRPVILADRGFHRASFLAWCQRHELDYVVRIKKGTCITKADDRQCKLGEEELKPGELRFLESVRYGLYHGRPRELWINLALCWKMPKSRTRTPRRKKQPEEPWYLATSLDDPKSVASWYWQRGWIEQSFKDAKSRFGLKGVRVGAPERLSRLLMGLTIALSWLTLMGLPEGGVVRRGFRSTVSAWGRASVISVALSLLEKLGNLPVSCLPQSLAHG